MCHSPTVFFKLWKLSKDLASKSNPRGSVDLWLLEFVTRELQSSGGILEITFRVRSIHLFCFQVCLSLNIMELAAEACICLLQSPGQGHVFLLGCFEAHLITCFQMQNGPKGRSQTAACRPQSANKACMMLHILLGSEQAAAEPG